ncbi:MAG: cysteine protease [Betaproteobacteria bacterium]|nr:cysteine protease [Betaproteobacteria bacterium]
MIFTNPAGAPELACDECGCRWFDRMTNACYECGTPVPEAEQVAFQEALAAFAARSDAVSPKGCGNG